MIRKIFGSSKIIPGFLINFLGLQVCRLLLSSLVINISRRMSKYRKKKTLFIKELESNGFLIKPFLNDNELKIVKDICDEEIKHARVIKRGKTIELICDNKVLMDRETKLIDILKKIGLIDYFQSIEGLKIGLENLNMSIEKTQFGIPQDYDINRQWHVDTFASHYKAWIPLEDICDDNFPMKYIPRSHLITFKRLFDEWVWSFKFKKGDYNTSGVFNQSRRAKFNMNENYDKESSILRAKAGSLIIADTSGFHRRGEGKTGSVRYWLRFGFRRSPFIFKFN